MTDKIITTFETVIMWFSPSDCLPKDGDYIMFYTKDKFFYSGQFVDYTAIGDPSKFYGNGDSFEVNEIMWWAELPVFN